MSHKLVVAVRGDLRMTPGKTAAQVAHAAVTATLAAAGSPRLRAWPADGQPKVVVRVASLEALEGLLVRAEAAGVAATVIADAGRTELEAGTRTCGAFGPDADDAVDAVTGELQLL
ncbi:MAG: aminoacyl-tRNA hydrolase [Candidatus Dormibacteraeota bacterium]|nr:aminoacyl-tRNA hydrolase [Candidatus Dormibacteraeota bacterium]